MSLFLIGLSRQTRSQREKGSLGIAKPPEIGDGRGDAFLHPCEPENEGTVGQKQSLKEDPADNGEPP